MGSMGHKGQNMNYHTTYSRYIIRVKTISSNEAVADRVRELFHDLGLALGSFKECFRGLFRPLVTKIEWQEQVFPGHPDYDKASEWFDATRYIGDITWRTHTK